MVDSVGPICWVRFVMITLSLWVTESITWVSTPKMCRSHSVEHQSHVATLHTEQHKSKVVKDTYCSKGKQFELGGVQCHLLESWGCNSRVESSVQHYEQHNYLPAIVCNPRGSRMMIYKCNTGIFSARIATASVLPFA